MEGFRWMQEGTVDAETVKGRFELLADFAALSYAAHDDLAVVLAGLCDLSDGVGHALLRDLVVLVEGFEMLKREAFGGDDVQCELDSIAIGFPCHDNILDIIWWGHRQGVDWLLYERRTYWH